MPEHVQGPAETASDRQQQGATTDRASDGGGPALGAIRLAAGQDATRTINPRNLLALQRKAGNSAARSLLAPPPGPVTVQREDLTAASPPFALGGLTITTYADAAAASRLYSAMLKEEADTMAKDGLAAPGDVKKVMDAGKANTDLWAGGGEEAFDLGNAQDLRAWYESYVKAMNGCRAAQAAEAAKRAQDAADKASEASDALDAMVPGLRDMQREAFRKGNDDGLLEIADAIAGVVDTSLVTKDAITKTIDVAADLRAWSNTGRTSPTVLSLSEKVPAVLDAIEQINKAYAAFQLGRAAIDLVTGGGNKTAQSSGKAAVSAMATTVSAGGTLLGASAGFTLYSNLYIGPMVSACLSLLDKVENSLSKGENRRAIEAGMFDLVRWQLEPGGREVFDFMLATMRAGSADGVPSPPAFVRNYMLEQEDSINAGVGGKSNELPTTGWWFWEEVDESKIKRWVFRNRQNLWGMLYGDCRVP